MTVLYLDLLGKGESGDSAALAFPPSKKMKVVIPNESADWRRNEESPFRKTMLSLVAPARNLTQATQFCQFVVI
jgi:hypothetical protein